MVQPSPVTYTDLVTLHIHPWDSNTVLYYFKVPVILYIIVCTHLIVWHYFEVILLLFHDPQNSCTIITVVLFSFVFFCLLCITYILHLLFNGGFIVSMSKMVSSIEPFYLLIYYCILFSLLVLLFPICLQDHHCSFGSFLESCYSGTII